MSVVSTSYEAVGRVDQKRRTRQALVAAARELVARGETPSVDAAAEAALVSRATAYRYFPNQAALLAAAHPETGATSLLPNDPPDEVEARLDLVIGSYVRTNLENEEQQRTMLRLSLGADRELRSQLPLRQGRAIGWIEEALAPLAESMTEDEVHRLAIAIRSATGIESMAWLIDVAGVPRDEVTEILRSTPGRSFGRR